MKRYNDKYLRLFFQNRFKDFETKPISTWEKIEQKIAGTSKTSTVSYKYIPVVSGLLILLSSVIGIYFDVFESKDIKELTQPTLLKNEIELAESKQEEKEKLKPISNQDENETINNEQTAKLTKVDVVISNPKDVAANNHVSLDNKIVSSIDARMHYGQLIRLSTEVSFQEFAPPVIQIKDVEQSYKSVKRKAPQFQLVFNPFYHTGTYVPLKYDNIQIGEFSQSSNVFRNRIGGSLTIGFVHEITQKLWLEYNAGYSFFNKDFSYKFTQFDSERKFETIGENVSGSAHSLLINIKAKSRIIKQPIFFSVSYSYVFGKELIPYLSRHIISYGIGFEKRIGEKILLRPFLQYGVPVGNGLKHFKLNPTSWGLEVVRELRFYRQ